MSQFSNDMEVIAAEFEQQYISLRRYEGRLYPDEKVAILPDVPANDPLKYEWEIRRMSSYRLIKYLLRKRRALDILEMGCGNGWLSNQLATIPGSDVTGADINATELKQASRLFEKDGLRFIYSSLEDLKGMYDIIIFAASFQYFKFAGETLSTSLRLLKKNGEIHIIDTKFYSIRESMEAAERSREYFTSAGHPEMDNYYFHHALADIEPFKYKMMFDPVNPINKLFKRGPFPWICIKK